MQQKFTKEIDKQISYLKKKFNFQLVIGAELEFYLNEYNEKKFVKFKKHFSDIEFEKEVGDNQFEVKFLHSKDIHKLIEEIINFRIKITKIAQKYEMQAIFNGKPFENMPGSALHFHISCYKGDENIFAKKNEEESSFLLYVIGGLCSKMLEDMIYFIPNNEGYLRLVSKSNAPTKVSWGGNNRTTAIRIPCSDDQNRRIEHRVSSADANPQEALFYIIRAMTYGFENKIIPDEKIFGDASDEIYNLIKLPTSYKEAVLLNQKLK